MRTRPPYPSDVTDDEWAFVAPYLSLIAPDALQPKHDLREVYNGLPGWSALERTGAQGRQAAGRRGALARLCVAAAPPGPCRRTPAPKRSWADVFGLYLLDSASVDPFALKFITDSTRTLKSFDGPAVQSIGDVKMELKPGQEGLGGVDVRVEDALKTLQTCQSFLRNMGKTIFKRRKPAAI